MFLLFASDSACIWFKQLVRAEIFSPPAHLTRMPCCWGSDGNLKNLLRMVCLYTQIYGTEEMYCMFYPKIILVQR